MKDLHLYITIQIIIIIANFATKEILMDGKQKRQINRTKLIDA